MKVAVVGATGLVGTMMLRVLDERNFPIDELIPVASERSVGKPLTWKGKQFRIHSMQEALEAKPALALFSAGGSVSIEFAEAFASNGTVVIDNSSAWRMDPQKALVVPEVNGKTLSKADKIIANPNCSTIQMVLVLQALHVVYGVKRVVVSTYQSVTGSGQQAVQQLEDERAGKTPQAVYPHPIDLNVLPHIDVFQENGYTKEEMKMVKETCKIMNDDSVKVTATAVRVPVMGGHSESVNVEFHRDFELQELKQHLAQMPGLTLLDNPEKNEYPMPLYAAGKDTTFVGRVRRDESQANTVNLWVVSDNLRKGAATNAVQIAEHLLNENLI